MINENFVYILEIINENGNEQVIGNKISSGSIDLYPKSQHEYVNSYCTALMCGLNKDAIKIPFGTEVELGRIHSMATELYTLYSICQHNKKNGVVRILFYAVSKTAYSKSITIPKDVIIHFYRGTLQTIRTGFGVVDSLTVGIIKYKGFCIFLNNETRHMMSRFMGVVPYFTKAEQC